MVSDKPPWIRADVAAKLREDSPHTRRNAEKISPSGCRNPFSSNRRSRAREWAPYAKHPSSTNWRVTMSEISASPKIPRRDWTAVLEDWKQSGKSQAGFCADRGIPIASFSGALSRARRAEPDSPPGFSRVKLPWSCPGFVEPPNRMDLRHQEKFDGISKFQQIS